MRGSHIVSLVIALFISLVAVAGCMMGQLNMGPSVQGSGKVKTETRNLPAFKSISSGGSYDVEVTVGPKQSVTVSADDNLLPVITTEVESGDLKIGSNKNFSSHSPIKIVITVPSLNSMVLAGSGACSLKGVKENDLTLRISGSGNITAEGYAKSLTAEITGSGNINTTALRADAADARVTGSGGIDIQPIKSLKATITGSGNISYTSNKGLTVSKTVTGSGQISER